MFPQLPNFPPIQQFNQLRQQFETFARNFRQSGQNPQQMVQQLLNNGQMTQDQFNRLRDMANQITGQRL